MTPGTVVPATKTPAPAAACRVSVSGAPDAASGPRTSAARNTRSEGLPRTTGKADGRRSRGESTTGSPTRVRRLATARALVAPLSAVTVRRASASTASKRKPPAATKAFNACAVPNSDRPKVSGLRTATTPAGTFPSDRAPRSTSTRTVNVPLPESMVEGRSSAQAAPATTSKDAGRATVGANTYEPAPTGT